MNTTANGTFTVPTRDQVSENNQAIFDNLHKMIGFVPNLYAYYAHSETALADYLALQNRKSSLTGKEREIINLVTSQINGCRYCQSAHSVFAKFSGLTEDQILEIRKGSASFDAKLNALVQFTASVVENRGRATEAAKEAFFNAGYNEANLIDAVIIIGDKTISNYLHNITGLEIDWPLAVEI
ncbi:MAG: alkylhydroperoxidase [Flavobacterium sp. BFFFF1]|uniref:carboxymuconolactone decarboxylase family protein n=1 Tax=Flavobacterium sp. BFFFF1 TaxID=2015557 RepID=UPI000BD1A4EA|nr:carboxymuconolactone decarboxylase family protein [Flavobacterium sp. BFFFF1]OYU80742.1 MAG: alkylhydroperoxidase [Flavobacterium sp. BFFFF1]